ncbi:MAG: creatininase family protein [Actinobacteria bacterium]|jgi:creatinine amidohydrolase|nr:creatininase family protein [Actinomycetota bacterium]
MNELAHMTTEEAAGALASAGLAIVPLGSCEQHGPHLSLDTDLAIADALARRLAADLGPDAVLCPPLGYGLSEHHLAFAGTLTLRPSTYLAVLDDLFESLHHAGLRRVLLVNGHGGNIDALRLAGRTARRDRGMLVASIMWAVLAADEVAAAARSDAFGHACETETSMALALVPDRVRTERLGPAGRRSSVDPMTDPPRASVDESVWLHQWSDDGALGDPRLATAAAGEQIAAAAHGRALDFARRMLIRPLPEES